MTSEYQEILSREIVTTRVFRATRMTVFAAWTDPEQLKLWWGPRGFTNTFHVCDMRAGGLWSYTMHGPGGKDYPNEARFVEITPPERIVIEHTSHPRFQLTATLEELKGNTKLTFRQLFESASVRNGIERFAVQGNEENMDRLAEFLAEK